MKHGARLYQKNYTSTSKTNICDIHNAANQLTRNMGATNQGHVACNIQRLMGSAVQKDSQQATIQS